MISAKKRKEQYKTASQRWRENHPDRNVLTIRKSAAKKYGLDPEEVCGYLETHDGLCDICGQPPTAGKKNLSIDHDHEMGEFRGLLCSNCNAALGLFKDNLDLLEKAARYLIGETKK